MPKVVALPGREGIGASGEQGITGTKFLYRDPDLLNIYIGTIVLVEATFRSPSCGSLKAAATRERGSLKAYPGIQVIGVKTLSHRGSYE